MNAWTKAALWWLCLVAAPLGLAGVELFHPSGFTADPGMYAYLCAPQPYNAKHWALAYFGPHWWVTLHLIQLPLLGLVSIGLWLAVDGVEGGIAVLCAWVSRVATFVFLLCYTALDSIGGIGLGRSLLNIEAMRASGKLTVAQAEGAVMLLEADWTDPLIGGVGSVVSEGGSWAVFVAAAAAALALLLARRAPWPALCLLVAFGWVIQISHASPYGPLGFSLLAIAGAWIGISRLRSAPALGQPALA